MSTKTKTIEYTFPVKSGLSHNVLEAMTQITAYIPEFTGTVTFKKVIFTMSCNEGAGSSAPSNYIDKRMDISVGGATATAYSNSNVHLSSGEQISLFYACDATDHFVTNWTTGTSKTIDCSVLLNNALGGAVILIDITVTFYITYEYDDSQTTQIKTIYIPLNAPTGNLPTSKPGTPTSSIPALDTELPEASKVYRNMYIVTQGNVTNTGSNTDSTLSMQIDSLTAYTSSSIEMSATSDRWTRFVWDITSLGMTTNSAHDFYLWSSVARHQKQQVYLVVTYEFNADTSTDIFVSLRLPMEIPSPMGTSNTIFQRGIRELWIQESNITTKNIAFNIFWNQVAGISGLNMRVGTGSFVTYADTAAVLCGSNSAMVRNDSAFTLTRGLNSLNFDIYTTDATNIGYNISGWWLINYTCTKPSQGCGAANHTVVWNLGATFDGAAQIWRILTANNPELPESHYFLNAVGTNYQYFTNGTSNAAGVSVLVETLSSETGGLQWKSAYTDIGRTDPETGLRQCWSQVRSIFKRWKSNSLEDVADDRIDITTARRWRVILANGASSFDYLDLYYTYHNIIHTVSGTISGSNGGTVNIDLYRSSGEKVLSTSRVGDGSYSFDWFDDTQDVFVVAYEDASYKGVSKVDTANTNFNISLSGTSSGEFYF